MDKLRSEKLEELKRIVGVKSDEQTKALYKEVIDVAVDYAHKHDFDLVLHYNDAITEEDFFSPANIASKVQARGLVPVYASPGMDISKEVVAILNRAKDAP